MSENTTKNQVFFLNTNITMSPKVDLFIEGAYVLSEASFDPFDITVPLIEDPDNPGEFIEPEFANYEGDFDFSTINEYSDLDYAQLEATVGLKYKMNGRSSLYGSVNIMDLRDDQQYVYGALTSTLLTYAAGMNVAF